MAVSVVSSSHPLAQYNNIKMSYRNDFKTGAFYCCARKEGKLWEGPLPAKTSILHAQTELLLLRSLTGFASFVDKVAYSLSALQEAWVWKLSSLPLSQRIEQREPMGRRMKELAAIALSKGYPALGRPSQESALGPARSLVRSQSLNDSSSSGNGATRIRELKKLARQGSLGSRSDTSESLRGPMVWETLQSYRSESCQGFGVKSGAVMQDEPGLKERDTMEGVKAREGSRAAEAMCNGEGAASARGKPDHSQPKTEAGQTSSLIEQYCLEMRDVKAIQPFVPERVGQGDERDRTTRVGNQVQKRQTMRELKVSGRRWSKEEDAILLRYVELYGDRNWRQVSCCGLQRSQNSCRLRYEDHLKGRKQSRSFSQQERSQAMPQATAGFCWTPSKRPGEVIWPDGKRTRYENWVLPTTVWTGSSSGRGDPILLRRSRPLYMPDCGIYHPPSTSELSGQRLAGRYRNFQGPDELRTTLPAIRTRVSQVSNAPANPMLPLSPAATLALQPGLPFPRALRAPARADPSQAPEQRPDPPTWQAIPSASATPRARTRANDALSLDTLNPPEAGLDNASGRNAWEMEFAIRGGRTGPLNGVDLVSAHLTDSVSTNFEHLGGEITPLSRERDRLLALESVQTPGVSHSPPKTADPLGEPFESPLTETEVEPLLSSMLEDLFSDIDPFDDVPSSVKSSQTHPLDPIDELLGAYSVNAPRSNGIEKDTPSGFVGSQTPLQPSDFISEDIHSSSFSTECASGPGLEEVFHTDSLGGFEEQSRIGKERCVFEDPVDDLSLHFEGSSAHMTSPATSDPEFDLPVFCDFFKEDLPSIVGLDEIDMWRDFPPFIEGASTRPPLSARQPAPEDSVSLDVL